MKISRRFWQFGHLVLLIVVLFGCSSLRGYTPTAEVKATLVRRAAEYITYILTNDQTRLEGMVVWADFLTSRDKQLDKTGYFKEVAQAAKLWPDANTNPLLNLDLRTMNISENEAEIILQKINSADSPKIRLFFRWTGSGWLVADDSLFGTDGLIATESKTSTDTDKG